jgi:hypothetical protein
MKHLAKLLLAVMTFIGMISVCAQRQQQALPLKVTKIKDNVF